MGSFTRRQFLRSAGGLTFLAFGPSKRVFGDRAALAPLAAPLFTALPYVQPGPDGALAPGAETVRLAWQTEQMPAQFEAHFGLNEAYDRSAEITRSQRNYDGRKEREARFNYVCSFTGLELGTEYRYRVRCNGEPIAEGYFTTRQPRGRATRFVAFGDNSFGDVSDRAIAYQAYRAHPDFVMNAGDNVYEGGLDNEYGRYFFPVYNSDAAGPRIGAPLLRSVPFYSVIANHDVNAKDPDTGHACADFDTDADSLGYFTNLYLPLNGPEQPAHPTPLAGDKAPIANFRASAGARYPRMSNYSYDAGDAHFLCLDSNVYVDPLHPGLTEWIERDLAATDALWKFVVCHHPPFNVGRNHYHEQQIRALVPAFERHGVDFVLSGHEHNYQRTVPLRFKPAGPGGASTVNGKQRMVPGAFTLDTRFDGRTSTRADGIIYLVTGAGGKHLYDAELNNQPDRWMHEEDGKTPYVAQVVTDRHSLTVFDLDGRQLTMRQVDERGNEIDRIVVTKA